MRDEQTICIMAAIIHAGGIAGHVDQPLKESAEIAMKLFDELRERWPLNLPKFTPTP